MNCPRSAPKSRTAGLSSMLAHVHAFETIDQFAMYEWARPRIDELRLAFYRSGEPTTNFPLWLRARFLAREVSA